MFGGSTSMPLFRIAGISVGANWTWLLALLYIVVRLTGDYQLMLGDDRQAAAFAFAVAVSFALFGSIILHEFGHAIVARRNGIGILGIDLWLLGGFAKMDREPNTPGVEFRVAAGGPAVTLAIALVTLGAAFLFDPGAARDAIRFTAESSGDPWIASLTWIGEINVLLLVFNLIPAYPLDGGRIARAIAWRLSGERDRGTRVAGGIGRVFGYLLIAVGVIELLAGAPIAGILFIFTGMMINRTASAAIAEPQVFGAARTMTVAEVMDRQPVALPADATVQRALDEYFWRYRWPWFPMTDDGGRFLGIVELNAVERVPEDQRAERVVAGMAVPGSQKAAAIRDDTPLTAMLVSDDIQARGAMMVVDGAGILRGVVTQEQVQRALRAAIEEVMTQRQGGQSRE